MAKKNKYQDFTQSSAVVDLHQLNGSGMAVTEEEVHLALDKFIFATFNQNKKQLNRVGHINLVVIVGKGLNSKRLINGKNPLRFFVENYLNHTNFKWRNGHENEGGEGVIVVQVS